MNRTKLKSAVAVASAACLVTAFAQPASSRLDRVLQLREDAELARQERTLLQELGQADTTEQPTVVAITGGGKATMAKLLIPGGVVRSYHVGDHIGSGWSIAVIGPDEVLVGKPNAKGPMKVVPLAFTRRESMPQQAQYGTSAVAPPPPPPPPSTWSQQPPVPPLPPAIQPPAAAAASTATAAAQPPGQSDFVVPKMVGLDKK